MAILRGGRSVFCFLLALVCVCLDSSALRFKVSEEMDFLEVACLKAASWLTTTLDLLVAEEEEVVVVMDGALSFSCNFFQFEESSAGAMVVAGWLCGGKVERMTESGGERQVRGSLVWWSL